MPYCIGTDGKTHSRYEAGVECIPAKHVEPRNTAIPMFAVGLFVMTVFIAAAAVALGIGWDNEDARKRRKP